MGISFKPVDVSNKNEIKSLFNEAFDESFPVILWQSSEDGRRRYLSAFIKEVNNEVIAFNLIQGNGAPIKFDDKTPVFVNITGHFSSFHYSYLPKFSSQVALVMKIPPTMRVSVFDRAPKNFYKDDLHNLMTYKIGDGQAVSQVILMNVNPFKAIFRIDNFGLDKLEEGSELNIISVSEHQISPNQKGIVRSICYFDPDRKGPFRPCRVSIILVPALVEMKTMPLSKEKQDERFGIEEVLLLKKNRQVSKMLTVDDAIEFQNTMIINEENSMELNKKTEDSGYFYGYEKAEQKSILKEIAERDANIAAQLHEHLEYLKKVSLLTLEMKLEIIQSLSIPQVATTFRLSTRDIIRSFLTNLPDLIQKQMVECLREQKMATSVLKAQKEFVKFIRYKEENGLYKLGQAA